MNVNKPVFKLFPQAAERVIAGGCALCGKQVRTDEFRDEESLAEFNISGMCQTCQDEFFEGELA